MDPEKHCDTCDCHVTVWGVKRHKVVKYIRLFAFLPYLIVSVCVFSFHIDHVFKKEYIPMYWMLMLSVALNWFWIILGVIIPIIEDVKLLCLGCGELLLDWVSPLFRWFCFLCSYVYNERLRNERRFHSLEHVVSDSPNPSPQVQRPNENPPPLPERQGSIVSKRQRAPVYDTSQKLRHRSQGTSSVESSPIKDQDALNDPTSGATGTSIKSIHFSGTSGTHEVGHTSGASCFKTETENIHDKCQLDLSHINVPISLPSVTTGHSVRGSDEVSSRDTAKIDSRMFDSKQLQNNPHMSLRATQTVTRSCAEKTESSASSYIPFAPDVQQNPANFGSNTGARSKTDSSGARGKAQAISPSSSGHTRGASGSRPRTKKVDPICQLDLSHIDVSVSLPSVITGHSSSVPDGKESSRDTIQPGSLLPDDTQFRNNPQIMSLGTTCTITGPCAEKSITSYIPFTPDTLSQNPTNFSSSLGARSETISGASGKVPAIPPSSNLGVSSKTSPKSGNSSVTLKKSPTSSVLGYTLQTSLISSSLGTNLEVGSSEKPKKARCLIPDTETSLLVTSFSRTIDETEKVSESICQLNLSHINVPISLPSSVIKGDSICDPNEKHSSIEIKPSSRSLDPEQLRKNPQTKCFEATRTASRAEQSVSSYIPFLPDTQQNPTNFSFPGSMQLKEKENINFILQGDSSQMFSEFSSNSHFSQSVQDLNEVKKQLSEPSRVRLSPQASPSRRKHVRISPLALHSEQKSLKISSEVSGSDPSHLRTIPKISKLDTEAIGIRQSHSGYVPFVPDTRQPNIQTATLPDFDKSHAPHIESNIISEHHETNLFTSTFGKTIDLTENIDNSILQLDASHIHVPILPRTEASSPQLMKSKLTSSTSTSSSAHLKTSPSVHAPPNTRSLSSTSNSPQSRLSPQTCASNSSLHMINPQASELSLVHLGTTLETSTHLTASLHTSSYVPFVPNKPGQTKILSSGDIKLDETDIPPQQSEKHSLNKQPNQEDGNRSIDVFADEARHGISHLGEQVSEKGICEIQSVSEGQNNEDVAKAYVKLPIPSNNDRTENTCQLIDSVQSLSLSSGIPEYNNQNSIERSELRRRMRSTSEKCEIQNSVSVSTTNRSKSV